MATITIDGTDYEFSTDFDVGEARVVKRYTNLNLSQLEGHDPSDPDLFASYLHILFRRLEPGLSFAELEAKADSVKLASMTMNDDDEVELVPPVPSESSETLSSDGEIGEHSNGSQDPSQETESRATTGLQQ